MGIDCKIFLPPPARISEVREVISILLGHTPKKVKLLQSGSDSWYVDVPGLYFVVQDQPSCAIIEGKDYSGKQ
jgi:hypothetical protein